MTKNKQVTNNVHKSTNKSGSDVSGLFRKAATLQKKKCIHPGCLLFASFGYQHKKKIYCNTHRPKKVMLFRHGLFCIEGCGKQANYGHPDNNIKTHCYTCKPEEYVSKKKICTFESCSKQAIKKNPKDSSMYLCSKHYNIVTNT